MLRVLIADDHAVVRQGVRAMLASHPDIEAPGEAASFEELLQRAGDGVWDVFVVDVGMPGGSVVDVVKRLRRDHPDAAILIFTQRPEDAFAVRLLRAGAAGFVRKDGNPDELVAALRRVAAGGRYLSPDLAERLARSVLDDEALLPHERLSEREFQVLRRLGAGETPTEVAARLHLSVKTVSTYRSRILEKLELASTAELIRYAVEHGLVDGSM